MAYEKHTWSCGETVTAEHLNHMEDGIAEGGGGSEPMIVTVAQRSGEENFYMDKTFGEIRNAFTNGQSIIVIHDQSVESETNMSISRVTAVKYYTSGQSVQGDVRADFTFNVYSSEPPYTLEALDALYPSFN